MKYWQMLIIVALGLSLAQESHPGQNQFSFRMTPDKFLLPLESWLLEPQDKASMWYVDIPDNVHFSMQFVEISNDVEYFIYPKSVQDFEFEFVLPKQKP